MYDSMLNTTANWFNAGKLNLSRLGMGRRVGGGGGGTFVTPSCFFFKFSLQWRKIELSKLETFLKFFGELLTCTMLCQLAGCCYGNNVLPHCLSSVCKKA